MRFIETEDELRTLYRAPHEDTIRKDIKRLDAHARKFLEKSPFVLIGTQDGADNGDVSPKGDKPGFVVALDDYTVAIPDRPGNNRLDTWENVLRNPAVGLIFLIPGMNETLRINGLAKLTADRELCEKLGVDGKPALSAMVVQIRSVYMHCAKAFMRSKLWAPQSWPDRSEMPTLGQILRDQLALSVAGEQIDADLDEAYRRSLW